MKRILLCLLIVGVVVVGDLLTKSFVVANGLPYTTNRGVAFSLLAGRLNLPIISTSVFLFVIFYWWYLVLKKEILPPEEFSFSLIIGGSLGNIVDRITRGGVIDFVRIYGISFNLADLAITLGLVIIFFTTLAGRQRVSVK